MQYLSIGSGSSGNCHLVASGDTRILVDAGISGKRTVGALSSLGLDLGLIDAILISHEHRDHIGCLGVLLRKAPIKVYATAPTIKAILKSGIIGEVEPSLFVPIKTNGEFTLGSLTVESFGISHDAADPVAYKFFDGKSRIAIVTDLGVYDDTLINRLMDLEGYVIEANHDLRMLETGIYPYHLKKRISSELGHLSNEDCGRLLSAVLGENNIFVALAHLSKENNYDKLAIESVALEITLSDNPLNGKDINMFVAPRDEAGELMTF